MSNSKAYSFEPKKGTYLVKWKIVSFFVRKLTQPEKFNEENSFQLNIAYSNFFHLQVTNKHVLCVD